MEDEEEVPTEGKDSENMQNLVEEGQNVVDFYSSGFRTMRQHSDTDHHTEENVIFISRQSRRQVGNNDSSDNSGSALSGSATLLGRSQNVVVEQTGATETMQHHEFDIDSISTASVALGSRLERAAELLTSSIPPVSWSSLEEAVLQYLVHAYKNKLDQRPGVIGDRFYSQAAQEAELVMQSYQTEESLRQLLMDDSEVDWTKVATHLQGKSPVDCRNKWQEMKYRNYRG